MENSYTTLHRNLDNRILTLEKETHPNQTLIKDLKKQKMLRDNPDNEEYQRKPDGYLNCLKNRYDPEHPTLPLWFSGKPFSFKEGRRAPVPQLIEPSSKELESGYIP